MNFLTPQHPKILISCAWALAACANTHPIKTVGPETYQITHSMGKNSPVKGVRSGIQGLAREKCAAENAPYTKLREEMTSERYLTYVLTFTCKPQLEGSSYNSGAEAARSISNTVNYTPPPSALMMPQAEEPK